MQPTTHRHARVRSAVGGTGRHRAWTKESYRRSAVRPIPETCTLDGGFPARDGGACRNPVSSLLDRTTRAPLRRRRLRGLYPANGCIKLLPMLAPSGGLQANRNSKTDLQHTGEYEC